MTGTVYRLYANSGYGFIRGEGEDDRHERFFHAKWVEPIEDFSKLKENTRVEFTPDNKGGGGNKLQAKNVKVLG